MASQLQRARHVDRVGGYRVFSWRPHTLCTGDRLDEQPARQVDVRDGYRTFAYASECCGDATRYVEQGCHPPQGISDIVEVLIDTPDASADLDLCFPFDCERCLIPTGPGTDDGGSSDPCDFDPVAPPVQIGGWQCRIQLTYANGSWSGGTLRLCSGSLSFSFECLGGGSYRLNLSGCHNASIVSSGVVCVQPLLIDFGFIDLPADCCESRMRFWVRGRCIGKRNVARRVNTVTLADGVTRDVYAWRQKCIPPCDCLRKWGCCLEEIDPDAWPATLNLEMIDCGRVVPMTLQTLPGPCTHVWESSTAATGLTWCNGEEYTASLSCSLITNVGTNRGWWFATLQLGPVGIGRGPIIGNSTYPSTCSPFVLWFDAGIVGGGLFKITF